MGVSGKIKTVEEVYEWKHIMKKLDHKNRLLLPKIIMDNIKANDFYVELYDDGSILLVPIKYKGGK